MDTQHLERLKRQHKTLQTFLQDQAEIPVSGMPVGLQITIGIYTQILEDGISILDAIISHVPEA